MLPSTEFPGRSLLKLMRHRLQAGFAGYRAVMVVIRALRRLMGRGEMQRPDTGAARDSGLDSGHDWDVPMGSGSFKTPNNNPDENEGALWKCRRCDQFRFDSDFTADEFPQYPGSGKRRDVPLSGEYECQSRAGR